MKFQLFGYEAEIDGTIDLDGAIYKLPFVQMEVEGVVGKVRAEVDLEKLADIIQTDQRARVPRKQEVVVGDRRLVLTIEDWGAVNFEVEGGGPFKLPPEILRKLADDAEKRRR